VSGVRMRPRLSRSQEKHRRALCIAALSSALALTLPAVAGADPASVDPTNADPVVESEAAAREFVRRGEFAAAAKAWAQVARESEDPSTRAVAAFRGSQSWLSAYEVDADPAFLCAARALFQEIAVDAELNSALRDDAQARSLEVDTMLVEHGISSTCADTADDESLAEASVETPEEREPLLAIAPRSSASTAGEHARKDMLSARKPKLKPKLKLVGGVSLGIGASMLGVMSYGLIVDQRSGSALRDLQAKKDVSELTAADWSAIKMIGDKGLQGSQIAVVFGISGVFAVVTGTALLLAGRHQQRHHTLARSLGVGVGEGQTTLTLRGQF